MKTKIHVVTFNLWCNYADPNNINTFIHREGMIYEIVKKENPDVIAFQEVVPEQLEVLERLFPEYTFYGHGRLEDFSGEGLYIAAKKAEFQLCSLDIFWLSPQPYVPASRFEFQSDCPRICIDLLLRHKKTGKMLRFYNVHLDHIGTKAKTQGMKVVLEKMTEDKAKLPAEIFLLGDFNEVPDSDTVRAIREYKEEKLIDLTASIPVSFHNFSDPKAESKIDYIFTTENLASHVEKVKIWNVKLNNIHLSDHYPISVTIALED